MARSVPPAGIPDWLVLLAAIAVGGTIAAIAPLERSQAVLLGITAFCIVLWIATPVPPWFTGLAGIGLLGLAFSPELALAGFAEPVLWLIVFGLIMGEAIHRSGIGRTVERRLFAWMAPRHRTEPIDPVRLFRRLLIVLCAGGLAFALVLPSSLVRVLIMAPILIEVGRIFESRRARLGLLFGPLFSTFLGAVGVLTAFLPNIVTTGILASTTGETVSWTSWFVAVFPVMGFGRVVLIIALVYVLYRPPPESDISLPTPAGTPDPTVLRRTVGILGVGALIWMTDAIHGLHPVFGALVVAMLLLTPGIGTVEFDTVEAVDFSIVFFVGAVFAIAAGMTQTGLTDVAATALLDLVPSGTGPGALLVAVFLVTMALMFVVEGLAAASVMTPVLIPFATDMGMPVVSVLQIEAIALGHFFFPYQSIVLVAMLGFDPIESRDLIRITSILSIATIVLLLPIQVAYLIYLW